MITSNSLFNIVNNTAADDLAILGARPPTAMNDNDQVCQK